MDHDFDRYAFRPGGAWHLDDEGLAWKHGLDALRASTRREMGELLAPRFWPPGRRFAESALRIGSALVAWGALGRFAGGESSRRDLSARLRRAFEPLGPAYIKLGQIVSSGRGVFPDELVAEFRELRDRVRPEPWSAVREVVESELGRSLEEVFERFEETPLASASIAQVHAARLRTGEDVVVKVQRPKVDETVRRDIRAMAWIAPKLIGRIPITALANPPALVEVFCETILEELDFRLEAENMLDIARVLAHEEQRHVIVPRPHPEYVTRRLLVMERLEGFAYDDVEGMRAAGVDLPGVVHTLVVSFIEGAMIHGVFHGDLHGGNLFVTDEGRIALLDYGMTGRLTPDERRAFMQLLMRGAIQDLHGQVSAIQDLGALSADADPDVVIRELELDRPPPDPTQLSSDELAKEMQRVVKGLLAHGARLPKPLMLYAKNMLFIDDAIGHLAPDLDLFAELARVYAYFATRHASTIVANAGIDPSRNTLDMGAIKRQVGFDEEATLDHHEIQRRRRVVRERLSGEDEG